jgi:hypothetical protein
MVKAIPIYGIDFSSAPCRRKPIAVAVGRLTQPDSGRAVVQIDRLDWLESLAAFSEFLERPGPWLGGFDLPFGQPRELLHHYRWPDRWDDFVDFFCQAPRPMLRESFRQWCNARPVGQKFAWRRADKPAGSSPAMRWTNPPVAWMMQAGIGRMKSAGLVFPAHRYPESAFTADGQLRASQTEARVALEAYPGFTARQVTRSSYKSDNPAQQTPERRESRELIVQALLSGRAGLSVRCRVSGALRDCMVSEARGDALDAVICALQAAHAATQPRFGLPEDLDLLEGWIAAVPDRSTQQS